DAGWGTWVAHYGGASRTPLPAPRSCARLSNHLFDRGNSLQHLHPRVHAQREHALLDGTVTDLGGARVHDDQPANLLTHRHHLVHALAPLEARSSTGVAPRALEEAELTDRGVERRV